MNTWLFPWWEAFRAPLSGNVTQDINPLSNLLCPQLEFNFAGNSKLESEIVANVASFGKQLGILTEAVLELANDSGAKGSAINRLKELSDEIESVKLKHISEVEKRVKADLNLLVKQDPQMVKQILREYG